MRPPAESRIVIVGAGVIGASVAYHLSLNNQACTIIEQCRPACAASGKSGGFLAKDWCDSSSLKHLARPSFQMHQQFASSLGTDIGYRTLESYSVSLVSAKSSTAHIQGAASLPKSLEWVNGAAKVVHPAQRIGSKSTNAQVLPKRLTEALLEHAKRECGSEVVISRVVDIKKDGNCWTLTLHDKDGRSSQRQFDIVVLCMGPWTIQAQKWFPSLPPIMAHKAASLVVKAKIPATALFTEFSNSRAEARSPEAYPREDEVYLCQSAVPEDLPDDPATIGIANRDVEDLKEFASAISSDLDAAMRDEANVVTQACNLPVSPDGVPVIGGIPGSEGTAFVAAGHSCWGILNSPATGKGLAELILTGQSSVRLSAFDPGRFGL